MGTRRRPRTTPLSATAKRDVALARFLRTHHSAIGLEELERLGFTRSGVRHLVERQVLIGAQRGAYRSGAIAPNLSSSLRCALLTVGNDAVVGRASAAHRLGLIDFAPPEMQIVVPRTRVRRHRPGIRVFSTPDLGSHEIATVDRLPCTQPLRTILDLSDGTSTTADFKLLRRAVRQATVKNRALPKNLERLVDKREPFRGSRVLRGVLDEHLEDTAVLRSDLEAAFLDLCREAKIPLPSTNVLLEGHEVDTAWVHARVVVELDTYAFHGDVAAFERDRARDAELIVAGYRIIRVTQRRLLRERATLVRQLRALVLPHVR